MDWNNAVRVEVNLPVELCDDSNKMIQITMDTGTIYTTELTMPFAVVSPEPTLAVPETPAVTPMLTESVPASTSYSLMLILVVCALAVVVILAIVFAVIFINRKKKAARNFEHLPMEDLVRNMQSQGTEILDDTEIEDGTDMVWDASPNLTLILHDVTTPARKQEVALQSVVAVGRDASICQVVLSYDSTVARHQCDIYANDGQVMVRNRSNSNITRVNDQKVVDECELVTGSLLKMGRVTMRVEIL